MKNELTSVRHVHSRPKEDYLYLDEEYVGRIRSDLTKELCDLWAEAHIEETVAQRVGRRLEKARVRLDLRPADVASRISSDELGAFGPSYLEGLEAGAWGVVAFDELEQLVKLYGLTLAELFAEEEPKI